MTTAATLTSVVVDASVALKWLLPEPHSAEAVKLLTDVPLLHAPDLLFPEIGNILWKRARAGEITSAKAQELLQWLTSLPIQLHPSLPLMPAAVEIACQYDRSVYDSLYLALAIREKSIVVTADEKLANALTATPLAAFLLLVQTF